MHNSVKLPVEYVYPCLSVLFVEDQNDNRTKVALAEWRFDMRKKKEKLTAHDETKQTERFRYLGV